MGLALALALPACGADTDAPAPMAADVGRPCPTQAEMAPTLTAMLEEDRLPHLAALLRETLPEAQLKAVLDAALRIVRALPDGRLGALLDLLRSERVAGAKALVAQLVEYARTSGPGDTLNVELGAALTHLLTACGEGPLFPALDAVLSTRSLLDLAAPLRQTLALPLIQTLLSAAGALNREALAALVHNVHAALVRPGADPAESVRALLRTVSGLTDLLDTPPVSTVVDGALAELSPSGVVWPPFQALLCCEMYGTVACPGVGSTLPPRPGPPVYVYLAYDVFLTRPAELDAALALLADREVTDQLAPLVEVLQTLGREPDVRRALVALVTTLLRPEIADGVLADLSLLLDSGAFDEVLAMVDAIVRSCSSPAPLPALAPPGDAG
jgi:hypothetical protein